MNTSWTEVTFYLINPSIILF